jgi:hypothetical protein
VWRSLPMGDPGPFTERRPKLRRPLATMLLATSANCL